MKKYYDVALTGNRFSGKTSVGKCFTQIGVPVFNADAVTKFLFGHHLDTSDQATIRIGSHIFNGNKIDPKRISDIEFDKLLEIVEFQVLEAYDKFKERQKDKTYTIFMCSYLFERDLNTKFNSIVSVFTPYRERVQRYKSLTGEPLDKVFGKVKGEVSDVEKNRKSNFVIHNYPSYGDDILDQIHHIDTQLVNDCLGVPRSNRG